MGLTVKGSQITSGQAAIAKTLLSVGIGLGSVIAGRLSRKHVEIGLVPLGSLGITVFTLMLARSGSGPTMPLLAIGHLLSLIRVTGWSALAKQRSPSATGISRLIACCGECSRGERAECIVVSNMDLLRTTDEH